MMLMPDPQPTGGFAWTQEPWGRALRCEHLRVPHIFTSRDLTLRQDEREWAAVSASLGIAPDRLRLVKQVHGIHAYAARKGDPPPRERPQADIIVTDDPSAAIGVRTADCAAILLHDPARNAVGAAHAGWRGAAADAAGAAVRAMKKTFGSRPEDLVAAIGPCLGACCGEVGPEVVEAFRAGGADPASMHAWFTPGSGDRAFLDLERANRDQLARAGLNPASIFGAGLCTKTHQDRFHSYRAAREQAGRMVAAVRCASG
jgi:YfiH family protein